jgi:hypothetical protein
MMRETSPRLAAKMADQRYLYLLGKYPQEVPGCGPWPLINTFSDEELKADLAVSQALRDEYDASTTEAAIGGGTIGGWIAQALRARPNLLQYPSRLDLASALCCSLASAHAHVAGLDPFKRGIGPRGDGPPGCFFGVEDLVGKQPS